VAIDDLLEGRGAPNLDGYAKWMAPGWFTRMSDGLALNDVIEKQKIVENNVLVMNETEFQNWKLDRAKSTI